jgi:hypothetical protein
VTKSIILILMVASLPVVSVCAANERQTLSGHVPEAVAKLRPVGRLEGSQRLKLAIGLTPRDEQGLDAFIQDLYDPASPNYRHYLAPAEFTKRFGPTEQDYKALIDYAKASGLNVTRQHSNRVVLDVEGTVADIEKALQVTLRTYPHPTEARTFYAPDTEPSLAVGVPVLHIAGLDNYMRPHPRHKRHSINRSANAAPAGVTPREGTAPEGQLWGNDFRDAYVPGTTLTGAGQSVGLLEFEGFYTQDIVDYANAIGMNATNRPQLVVVSLDGGATPDAAGDEGQECSIDIEMAMSMAPGLSNIYVFEDGSNENGTAPFDDVFEAMVSYTNVLQFSCSWGGNNPEKDPTSEVLFKQMAAQGQSFFNASGDTGAFVGGVDYPSDSPSITQVGGTTMTDGGGPSYPWESEVVWDWDSGPDVTATNAASSSGGISTYYAIPSWQANISMAANGGSTTMRNTPDVAANADNCYIYYGNGQGEAGLGGTSCAVPLWAGFAALMNQQAASSGVPPVGFLNPALYALASSPNYTSFFHDITSGNNTWKSSPRKFYAVAGYNLCCGLGTMNGTNLINALVVPSYFLPVAAGYNLATTNLCGTNWIYPGETVTVNLALTNAGSIAGSNVVTALLPYLAYRDETAPGVPAPAYAFNELAAWMEGSGIAFPSGPLTNSVIPGGANATNTSFSFFDDGACGQTITAVLQLQDGSADYGTVSYILTNGGNCATACSNTCVSTPNMLFPTNGFQSIPSFLPALGVAGQAPPGSTVILSNNGALNTVVQADGNGIYQIFARLQFGSNVLTLSSNVTNSIYIPLAAPDLQVPPVANTNVAVSGMGAAGATVYFYEGDSPAGTPLTNFVCNAWGNFSGTITLPPGGFTLTATETIGGLTNTNAALFPLSVVPLPPPTIISPYNGLIANKEAQTLSGNGVAGATVTISNILNGVTTNLATTTVNRAGKYSVAVNLADGVNTLFAVQETNKITSPPSALVVVSDYYLAPVILVQPVNQTGFLQGSVTFSAEVAGAAPMQFFWEENGVRIPGAVTSKLTLSNLKTSETTNTYRLVASNKHGGTSSLGATVTLVANPFPSLAGAYRGLFTATNSAAQFESSGLLTLNLTSLGRFTARILNAGGSYSFSGGLSGVGWWSNTVSRGASETPLTVVLNMNVTNSPGEISGTVSDGISWTAGLEADRAAYSQANPFPNPGKFTLLFGDTNNGAGFGTVNVNAAGMVSLSGVLSDDTSVAPGAVSVSTNGRWPLYIPLYGRFGSLVSWIYFTNNGVSIIDLTNTNTGVCSFAGSNAMWFRINGDGKFYPGGFTNAPTIIGSAFAPGNNATLLDLASLEVILGGGDLPEALANSVSPSADGKFTVNGGGISGLSLTLNPATGVIKGRFADPVTTEPDQIKGVVFQEQTNAGGFFLGATNTGNFLLTHP